ncbi:heterokaryon incompatibility protein-domain-containing protein [Cercophora newfieldiana]|uniref:Heterokaryon incompatibility protein-domain-containing protein n=1 Tax=Cercophora newfieldiana TaxID=92897 RepID=A0AA39YBC5_9PEZI|nr:heterokaryon incompatibility protein-domain-containing protein [Cercophora newfieldiana]
MEQPQDYGARFAFDQSFFLTGQFCQVCQDCELSDMFRTRYRDELMNKRYLRGENHHKSFRDLSKAAADGCQLCPMFKQMILASTSEFLSCSLEEAETRHLEVDVAEQTKRQVIPQNFMVEFFLDTVELAGQDTKGFFSFSYFRKSHIIGVPLFAPSDWDRLPYFYLADLPEGLPQGRYVNGIHASPEVNLYVARSWVGQCLTGHSACPKPWNSELPSRVLDTQPNLVPDDVQLVDGFSQRAEYTTLSHCWGNSQPLKLTKASNDNLRRGISIEALPKTFRDAVLVTKSLGIRYLWIDSLCIMQDDTADWESQCAKMADIYKRSYVTIAGPSASGCDSGFLHPRPPTSKFAVSAQCSGRNIQLSFSNCGFRPLVPQPESPLAKRAWVFQERLLSPRVLYFGHRKLYFECFTHEKYEECPHSLAPKGLNKDRLTISKLSTRSLPTVEQQLEYWNCLVSNYSRLALTKSSDRLPALSGLASEFSPSVGGKYLAGVWGHGFPDSLAWSVPVNSEPAKFQTHPDDTYLGPSWSWVSARHVVEFCTNRILDRCDGGDGTSNNMALVSAEVPPAGRDPFGAVSKDSFLEISGKTRTAVFRRVSTEDWWLEFTPLEFYIESKCWYYPDDPARDIHDGEAVTAVFLGRYNCMALRGNPSSSHLDVALCIEPVDGQPDTYRRIGLAMAIYHRQGPRVRFRESFDNEPTSCLRIL